MVIIISPNIINIQVYLGIGSSCTGVILLSPIDEREHTICAAAVSTSRWLLSRTLFLSRIAEVNRGRSLRTHRALIRCWFRMGETWMFRARRRVV